TTTWNVSIGPLRLDDLDWPHDPPPVKTLTMEKFFNSPGAAQSLLPGQSLVVTSGGKPELIVTKAGQRPKKTAEQMRRDARALLKKPGNKVDTVALLRELRK
ncbi:MAG: hypothetical protein ACREUU_15125, partial [Gammaproteobacteria bacterium]